MVKMNAQFKQGICAIVIAIVLLFVSGIDRIEIVGKYKVSETGGRDVSQMWESMGFDEEVAKMYMSFGLFGNVNVDVSIDSSVKDDLDEEELDFLERVIESMTDSVSEYKWSLDDGEIVMENADGEEEDGEKYTMKFNELIVGKRSSGTVLKRAGIMGYLCPSMIIRAISVIVFLLGILLLLYKKDTNDNTGYAQMHCPYCGKAAMPEDKFCQSCGSAISTITSMPPKPTPSTNHCMNCGHAIPMGDMFCENCGTPVGGAYTTTIEPTPAPAPAPVAEAPKPTSGLRSTFEKQTEEPASAAAPKETSENPFKSAGDL